MLSFAARLHSIVGVGRCPLEARVTIQKVIFGKAQADLQEIRSDLAISHSVKQVPLTQVKLDTAAKPFTNMCSRLSR